jgi:hypothetical protein
MRSTILNREFEHPADGWYQIETPGEHLNAKAGLVQVIDGQAVSSIVNRFNQEAADYEARTSQPYPGMVVDIEHFKHDPDKESRAYGWLMQLENRDGVPFGKIQWTATGKPAVDGGDYRFFSTEYDPADLKVLNPGKSPARVRPLRLDGLTLTNDPNNKGGTPITNREPWEGYHASKADFEAAREENQRHCEANKAAATAAELQAQQDSEGEAVELALPDLEKWFRAVHSVMDSSKKTGCTMMTLNDAFTYARSKWPDLYAAAFGNPVADSNDAPAEAGKEVTALANRIAQLAGKNFDFGFNFVRAELPHVFNRMTPVHERVENRATPSGLNLTVPAASKVFNRLSRAEAALKGLPDSVAWQNMAREHPGLFGLVNGTKTPYEAVRDEPGIAALLSDK